MCVFSFSSSRLGSDESYENVFLLRFCFICFVLRIYINCLSCWENKEKQTDTVLMTFFCLLVVFVCFEVFDEELARQRN